MKYSIAELDKFCIKTVDIDPEYVADFYIKNRLKPPSFIDKVKDIKSVQGLLVTTYKMYKRHHIIDEIKSKTRSLRNYPLYVEMKTDPPKTPEGQLMAKDLAMKETQALHQVMSKLSTYHQHVLQVKLMYFDDCQQAASVLDINVRSYHDVLKRAYKAFKRKYKQLYREGL